MTRFTATAVAATLALTVGACDLGAQQPATPAPAPAPTTPASPQPFFVGHPVGAHHVAWNDGPDWEINPHFVGQVKKVASMNRPIVLICRSGHRSLDAGVALEKAGFGEVYNVVDGFEGPLDDDHHRGTHSGWRKEGLPWEQL